jgi:hypothetical protein
VVVDRKLLQWLRHQDHYRQEMSLGKCISASLKGQMLQSNEQQSMAIDDFLKPWIAANEDQLL